MGKELPPKQFLEIFEKVANWGGGEYNDNWIRANSEGLLTELYVNRPELKIFIPKTDDMDGTTINLPLTKIISSKQSLYLEGKGFGVSAPCNRGKFKIYEHDDFINKLKNPNYIFRLENFDRSKFLYLIYSPNPEEDMSKLRI